MSHASSNKFLNSSPSLLLLLLFLMRMTRLLVAYSAAVTTTTRHTAIGRPTAGWGLPLRPSFSSYNNHFFRRSQRTLPKVVHPSSSFHTSPTACYLNRFLFSPSDVDKTIADNDNDPIVTLPIDDYRTIHAAKILGLRNGDTIRAGVVQVQEEEVKVASDDDNENEQQKHQGLMTDEAVIQWIPEGKVKKAEPLKNGNPPGSLRICLKSLDRPKRSIQAPPVSLILALPRPLQLGRMLPMISQMGVDTLVLTGAQKVPKDYFGSHLFRKPEQLTQRLIEGLCQSGVDVQLPKLRIIKNLSNLLNNDNESNDNLCDELFPRDEYARVIAHPQRTTVNNNGSEPQQQLVSRRMRYVEFPNKQRPRIVVAVGPEGGWDEPDELDKFRNHGFQQITMGDRVLRSDCAVVSLLGLAHDACDECSTAALDS